jgi:DNA-binding protein HU-beta
MRKQDLVRRLADEHGLTLKESADIVSSVFGTITSALLKGDSYHHSGFGTFHVVQVNARKAHNVTKNKIVRIPRKKIIRLRVSRLVKKRLNSKA